MSVSTWFRDLWRDPRTQEVIRQVIVALLLALLSVLGYDRAVALPRAEALEQALEQRAAQMCIAAGVEAR